MFLRFSVTQKNANVPQVQYNDKVVEVPVVMQRPDPICHTVQKTTEAPQCIDKAEDMPGLMQRQIPFVQRLQKMVEVPQIQFIDKVMDAPVNMQRQVQVKEQSDDTMTDTMAAVTTGVNPNTSGAMAPHR